MKEENLLLEILEKIAHVRNELKEMLDSLDNSLMLRKIRIKIAAKPTKEKAKSIRELKQEMLKTAKQEMEKELGFLPNSKCKKRLEGDEEIKKSISVEEKKRIQWLLNKEITEYTSIAYIINRDFQFVSRCIREHGGKEAFMEADFDTP